MKKTKNEVLQFLAGLVMLIVGLYIFFTEGYGVFCFFQWKINAWWSACE